MTVTIHSSLSTRNYFGVLFNVVYRTCSTEWLFLDSNLYKLSSVYRDSIKRKTYLANFAKIYINTIIIAMSDKRDVGSEAYKT